ncbi:hypothetical protein ACIGXM_08035 [Kitasatospora sp. NPDC052896]|uniref:hypothetical protein n=1 Tax=Kitasatospora sp. NPDC052896 TaxID=3364061 RepID=UPI0037CA85E5
MTSEKGLGPVTVELTGIAQPATFARVSDALAALWESIRVLPLGSLQHNWFREMLTGPEALPRTEESLQRHGEGLELPFTLADGPHLLTLRPAVRVSSRPRDRRRGGA